MKIVKTTVFNVPSLKELREKIEWADEDTSLEEILEYMVDWDDETLEEICGWPEICTSEISN